MVLGRLNQAPELNHARFPASSQRGEEFVKSLSIRLVISEADHLKGIPPFQPPATVVHAPLQPYDQAERDGPFHEGFGGGGRTTLRRVLVGGSYWNS